jgi:hypothetical protein
MPVLESLTVREINRLVLTGTPVVAVYTLAGIAHQGRILRARRRAGVMEGKVLDTGRWAPLVTAWDASRQAPPW